MQRSRSRSRSTSPRRSAPMPTSGSLASPRRSAASTSKYRSRSRSASPGRLASPRSGTVRPEIPSVDAAHREHQPVVPVPGLTTTGSSTRRIEQQQVLQPIPGLTPPSTGSSSSSSSTRRIVQVRLVDDPGQAGNVYLGSAFALKIGKNGKDVGKEAEFHRLLSQAYRDGPVKVLKFFGLFKSCADLENKYGVDLVGIEESDRKKRNKRVLCMELLKPVPLEQWQAFFPTSRGTGGPSLVRACFHCDRAEDEGDGFPRAGLKELAIAHVDPIKLAEGIGHFLATCILEHEMLPHDSEVWLGVTGDSCDTQVYVLDFSDVLDCRDAKFAAEHMVDCDCDVRLLEPGSLLDSPVRRGFMRRAVELGKEDLGARLVEAFDTAKEEEVNG